MILLDKNYNILKEVDELNTKHALEKRRKFLQ